jgi:hypothetical protein
MPRKKRTAAAPPPEPKRQVVTRKQVLDDQRFNMQISLDRIEGNADEIGMDIISKFIQGRGSSRENAAAVLASAPDIVGAISRPEEPLEATLDRAEKRLWAACTELDAFRTDASFLAWMRYLKALADADPTTEFVPPS